jgi:hypothetical protein
VTRNSKYKLVYGSKCIRKGMKATLLMDVPLLSTGVLEVVTYNDDIIRRMKLLEILDTTWK